MHTLFARKQGKMEAKKTKVRRVNVNSPFCEQRAETYDARRFFQLPNPVNNNAKAKVIHIFES